MLKAKVHTFDEDDERPAKGLVDGGHTILNCSACGKGLIDIYHTQPKAIDPKTNKPFNWKIQALCCYCGDHSFTKEVKGKFHLAGYGTIKEDDPTQDIPETFPGNIDYQDDVVIIQTVKA